MHVDVTILVIAGIIVDIVVTVLIVVMANYNT